MRKLILSTAALGLALGAAFAGPIEDREAIMKERAGLLRQLSPMAKGEQPFDAARAEELLTALEANATAKNVAELFPEGSGEGTEASPKIWEDFAAFEAEWDKYTASTTAAAAAKPQDQASLQTQFGAVAAGCGSCHQAFRISKN